MSLIAALILGLVQGLTEFFPVSSSAHLKLTKMALGLSEFPVTFDLVCHLGTLVALLWFFKTEVIRLFVSDRKKLVYLFVALLPLIPCYFLLKSLRLSLSKPEFLGIFLILTGSILLLGQKIRIKPKKGVWGDILLIGTMQSAALIPGISRSASTISCAQVLGWEPKEAVRFSFLLAIPTIFGGNLIEIRHLWKTKEMAMVWNLPCLIGFFTSFVVGMAVIQFAIRWLERGNFKLFGWYCITIGLAATGYFYVVR